MVYDLTTEAVNPASINLDTLGSLELVELINKEDASVAGAVWEARESVSRAIDLTAERLRQGGRLIYAGAGTSGRLGVLDAAECPPTFNAAPGQILGLIAGGESALLKAVEGAEDSPEAGIQDLEAIQVSARDVVMGIAASGTTPYVLGAVRHARSLGALSLGFYCNKGAPLESEVDIPICVVVGPEVLSGSTRMKAGTATKMVLNMLTTGIMVRLGKTYGNLMVDLQATNKKLEFRSLRILRQLTDLGEEQAIEKLKTCDGELKTSIVSERLGISPEDARLKLQHAEGRLREALGDDK